MSETAEMFIHSPDTETRERLARQSRDPRPTIHEAQRRPFGLEPPALLAGLGATGLTLAIVLLSLGAWIVGTIALVVAIASIVLLAAAIRHDQTSRSARALRRVGVQLGSLSRFAFLATRTRAGAALSLIRVRQRRVRLQHQLQSQLAPLGEAVYRGDQERAAMLQAQATRLDEALKDADREASAVIERAHDELEQEKLVIQPTEALPVSPPRRPAPPGPA